MPLGQGVTQMVQAVRDRIEVSEGDGVWHVTAGSFDAALDYARERFGDPAVLARQNRGRWWPRVMLTVTTDPVRAAEAPALEELASPAVPEQRSAGGPARLSHRGAGQEAEPESDSEDDQATLPPSLEAIFARQARR